MDKAEYVDVKSFFASLPLPELLISILSAMEE